MEKFLNSLMKDKHHLLLTLLLSIFILMTGCSVALLGETI